MKACRTGSIVAFGALFGASAIGACRGEKPPLEIPPVTVARPTANTPVLSGPIAHTTETDAAPANVRPMSGSSDTETTCPVTARFVEAPAKIADGLCTLTMIAVARGKLTVMNETLDKGDVLVLRHALEAETKGNGLAVEARMRLPGECVATARPAPEKTVIRAVAAAKLEWAGGKMAAWLDVGPKVSPDLYLGRLEGTAAVAEHVHPSSWEIVASIEASGTFMLDGKEAHLGPRQIVAVPPNAKHAWKPDPGTKLVAIQMYTPPGPEQRFVTLAAEAKDGGVREAGAPREAGP